MPKDISGNDIDYSLTKYVASRDIISVPDLISFFKSDSCLKIVHTILRLKCGLYFNSEVVGTGQDNSEHVLLFKINNHEQNMLNYIKYANRLFLIKKDVCNAIKSEPWLAFKRKGTTPETIKFPPEYTISFSVIQVSFLLATYSSHTRLDIKYEFNKWCHGTYFSFIDNINEECSKIEYTDKINLNVSRLNEYNPDMTGHIHSIEDAKQYAKNNTPSNEIEEINLMHDLKTKFMLSNSQIASIIFERETRNADINTLTKRVQRKLQKFDSPRNSGMGK